MIKTTRIKVQQAPRMVVHDLSSQVDGITQSFTLPRAVDKQAEHYLIFNSTVYRNDKNHVYYSTEGNILTTYFDQPPLPGPRHNLQFVLSDNYGDSEFVTRDEMNAAIEEAINRLKETN